ncbi:hypothetical protein BASA50_008883 [Batrachochytrium salamandrivorans]|uniref:MULE transposase domain-containing protein n=1 Tax=Batrachochytrium salamandrivorans TaxID=1357716 RepID=A0ABQ8F274_9FUNG|nr:hypothetical protein BASA50_008883 [Batrachochytrium salamandrivorans]
MTQWHILRQCQPSQVDRSTLASVVIHSVVSPQATVVITDCEFVATEVLSTVLYVQPSSLVDPARLKHGVTFSYSSAWRALQCHYQDISKADVISFGQILYFLHEIEITNSGSTTYVAATSEETIPEIKQPEVVIVHDWEKGLQQNQRQVLPFPFESICVWHLEKNVNPIFKSKFGGQIWAAAKAGSQVKHDEAMTTIAEINCDSAEYLKNLDPKRWARSHFPVPRFGAVISNSAKSLNS